MRLKTCHSAHSYYSTRGLGNQIACESTGFPQAPASTRQRSHAEEKDAAIAVPARDSDSISAANALGKVATEREIAAMADQRGYSAAARVNLTATLPVFSPRALQAS